MASETEAVPSPQTPPPVPESTDPAPGSKTQVASDKPPSPETITKAGEHTVLDNKGEKHSFKSLYDGSNASRTLVVFIRHFFCGSCQEFIIALSKAITPSDLQKLPTPTSLIIIGCGDPGLIDFYAKETSCPFPIYADPERNLYKDFELVQNYGLGSKPEYFRKSMVQVVGQGIMQAVKNVGSGLAFKAGESSQNGGEFLFEAGSDSGSEKTVTWCHRMTNTRDHLGIEELKRFLDSEHQVFGKN